jgi:hypothetical protein
MIPRNTSKSIHTHKNIRSMRSLFTKVGPAQGQWSRLRETEQLARRQRPVLVRHAPHH